MSVCEQCSAELQRDGERCARCGHAPGEPLDEMVGREVLGRYRIARVLAEGGMGRVYLANQAVGTALRQVAIKVLRRQLSTDPQIATRFAREAETLVRLTHPNTVQLFDFGSLPDGTLALVMEYVKGHSLAEELTKGPLPLARVKRILTQVGGALKEAHAHGIVHRDLKPDNVLIAHREGQADFVKVLDFGIASVSEIDQATRTRLTQQGMMVGTPPYMSPEQFSGDRVDPRSDVYSLALIAYELLSGRLPFDAKTPWEWASKHMTQQPEPLNATRDGRIGSAQVRAIHRALAKKADDRPTDVDAFLREFTGEGAPLKEPAVAAAESEGDSDDEPPPGVRSGRRLGLAVGAVALVAVAALFSARALWSRDESASAEPTSASSIAAAPPPPPSAPLVRPPEAAAGGSAADIPEGRAMPATIASSERRHRGDGSRSRAKEAARPPAPAPATAEPPPERTIVEPAAQPAAQRSTPPAAAPTAAQPPATRPPAAAARTEGGARPPSAPPRTPAVGMPPDLEQRLTRIHEAATKRPELAIGLFQAAASRYSGHPALASMRELLRKNGRERILALRQQNLCPQAQALHRALASIEAASPSAQLFGGPCPAP